MKIKIISIAVATVCFSQLALSQVKTIDFYSANGSNRYSLDGTIKELNLKVENNGVFLPDANQQAYVKVNGHLPYFSRFSDNGLNAYQVIENNKGKKISFKDGAGKLQTGEILGLTGEFVSIKFGGHVLFVKMSDLEVPLSFYYFSNKGLQVFFPNFVKDTDKIFISQAENQLNYNNTYDALISGKNIEVTQFFNINNFSQKTFDGVKLNFFLSDTNIRDDINPRMPQLASAGMRMEKAMMDNSIDVPSFTADSVKNLKFISIDKPTTIYPDFNKIKYAQNTYPLKEYAKINFQKRLDLNLYSNDFMSLTNDKKKEMLEDILVGEKKSIYGIDFLNYIEFQPKKDEILPAGKISVYQKTNNAEKLIISTQMNYTENSPVVLLKNKNSDLKITDVKFEQLNPQKLKISVDGNRIHIGVEIQSIDVINNGTVAYDLKVLDKIHHVKPGQKTIIVL